MVGFVEYNASCSQINTVYEMNKLEWKEKEERVAEKSIHRNFYLKKFLRSEAMQGEHFVLSAQSSENYFTAYSPLIVGS